MSARAASNGPRRRGKHLSEVDVTEFFAPQPTPTSELPDPEPLLRNLTVGLIECLAGVREVEQLARWMSQEAFLSVAQRVALATRARSATSRPAVRPVYRVTRVRHMEPADGVVEACIVVDMPARTRVLAIRLEGTDRRWRASSVALL